MLFATCLLFQIMVSWLCPPPGGIMELTKSSYDVSHRQSDVLARYGSWTAHFCFICHEMAYYIFIVVTRTYP